MTNRRTQNRNQGNLEEQVLNDDALVKLMEDWWRKDTDAKAMSKVSGEAKDKVMAHTAELSPGLYRVGETPFIIAVKISEPRHVEFDAAGGKRSVSLKRPKSQE
jgi:hypothetical protein